MTTLKKNGEWIAKAGDIFRHTRQKELLCLVLEDTPDTPESATKVRFLTGNKYMSRGFEVPVLLVASHYFPLRMEKK